jgi:regulator of sirC expression with transglutaminase-like and TPR domain
MTPDLQAFSALVAREDFDLARACLHLARDEYPDLDAERCIGTLDAMAATIRGRLAADAFAEQRVAALNHHLFVEQGFRGNADAYYDPRNSYLNEVLERRLGIPITLSIVYMEVGRRVGLALQGVSFPGHFMVKLRVRRGELVLDPYAGGLPRGSAELRERLREVMPGRLADGADLDPYLAATPPRQILARVLRNLKSVYMKAGDADRSLAVANRMLALLPDALEELRDRGTIYAHMGAFRAALEDLQSYLRRRPDAPDATDVRARVVELAAACARLN